MMDHIPISFIFTLYRYLSTSRGAGNRISLAIEAQSWYSIDTYLSTSREDGNWISSKCWIWFVVSIIPIYLERGQKQLIFSFLVPSFFVYHPIYLARGRKQCTNARFSCHTFRIDTYLPREGPETDCMCNTDVSWWYRTLSTSRGAGNRSGKDTTRKRKKR